MAGIYVGNACGLCVINVAGRGRCVINVLKAIQAKDIDDTTILDWVAAVNKEGRWAYTFDFDDILPDVPYKVILAKCRSLIRRKLLQGCACGCRGDFYIPGGEWGD